MRTLIIQLPLGLPSQTTTYAHTWVEAAGTQPVQMQWAAANLLPVADKPTETVVLLPAVAVSWHRVDLPPGLHKQAARLQAALQGLLEDRVLDDPAQLHMALQPNWQDAQHPWVAVCERAWLNAHLHALEQAGLMVSRIVPELSPATERLQVTALGDADSGWLWTAHPEHGLWGQPIRGLGPLSPGMGIAPDDLKSADIQAEPGAVALTSELTGQSARLMSPGQHWLAAMASPWDLAQFDLRVNARARHFKIWQRAASTFWHNPAWKPARWGLLLLVGSQLVGFNVWAWKTRSDWQAQQESWSLLLRETFPKTQVVVDAPLQMAREVERLRQASGQLNANDLESMLASLGHALPAGLTPPNQWTYEPGQLRLKGFKPNATEQQSVQKTLAKDGYLWRAEGDGWLMTMAPPAQEVKP